MQTPAALTDVLGRRPSKELLTKQRALGPGGPEEAKVATMTQRSTRKDAMRRGSEVASSHRISQAQILRLWLRLWFPIALAFFAQPAVTPVYATPVPTSVASVAVTADVQQSFTLTVDEEGLAVASNVPWSIDFWQFGCGIMTVSGAPTAHSHVAIGDSPVATVVPQ